MRPLSTGEMDQVLLERLVEGAKRDRDEADRLTKLLKTRRLIQDAQEADALRMKERIAGLAEQADRLLAENKTAAAKASYTATAVRRALELLRDIQP